MSSGQKMGKSLGNVINVHLALEQFPAETLRLYYLQNLYRSALPWSDQALPDALGMLARLYEARETAEAMGGEENPEQLFEPFGKDAIAVYELGTAFEEKFYEAMDNDFNTAKAIGYLMQLARAINRFSAHKKAKKRGGPLVAPALRAFQLVGEAVGLFQMSTGDFHEEVKAKRLSAMGINMADIEQLLTDRVTARQEKNWEQADAIRAELEEKKIMVLDTPEGVQWRVRLSSPDDE
jgi:cysteinyl-tRNA synthetase